MSFRWISPVQTLISSQPSIQPTLVRPLNVVARYVFLALFTVLLLMFTRGILIRGNSTNTLLMFFFTRDVEQLLLLLLLLLFIPPP